MRLLPFLVEVGGEGGAQVLGAEDGDAVAVGAVGRRMAGGEEAGIGDVQGDERRPEVTSQRTNQPRLWVSVVLVRKTARRKRVAAISSAFALPQPASMPLVSASKSRRRTKRAAKK